MKEMTTEELIKFLIETEYINYCDDHEIIDKVIEKLKDCDKTTECVTCGGTRSVRMRLIGIGLGKPIRRHLCCNCQEALNVSKSGQE